MNIRLRRNIYVMNADGTQRVQVTVNTTVNSAASWSPDGTKIAFARVIDGNDEIYVMNADCSNQLRLTNNEFEDNWPRWSPDGSKIVFDSHRGLGTGKAQSNIFVINADGTGETNLTPNSFVNSMPD